jgi:cytochrome c-type biogenesis protein CcmH
MTTILGKLRRSLVLGSGLIAVALAASACLSHDKELSLEEQALRINQSLMCPVCPGETIDQSQVELAKQMRVQVREKLAAGESRSQILDYFVARFGEDVLAAPPKQGAHLIAWVVPGVGLTAFGAVLFLVLRAMRFSHSPEAAPLMTALLTDEELKPYLSRVDEEMSQVFGDSPSQGMADQEVR